MSISFTNFTADLTSLASAQANILASSTEMVKRLLQAKPWEGVEKLPIGFELHRPKPLPDDDDPALLEAP